MAANHEQRCGRPIIGIDAIVMLMAIGSVIFCMWLCFQCGRVAGWQQGFDEAKAIGDEHSRELEKIIRRR